MPKTTVVSLLELSQVGYWLDTEDILGKPMTTQDNNKDKHKTTNDDLGGH